MKLLDDLTAKPCRLVIACGLGKANTVMQLNSKLGSHVDEVKESEILGERRAPKACLHMLRLHVAWKKCCSRSWNVIAMDDDKENKTFNDDSCDINSVTG